MNSFLFKGSIAIRFKTLMCLLSIGTMVSAQTDTLHALFIGNSYTAVNNLPQLTANLSAAAGKTLIIDSNTPGGYSYDMHSGDSTSLAKIRQGGWDVIVLQEQSQIPTIDQWRYNDMYPGALRLRDSIRLYNPCATILTYMTWGRRYGGQQCLSNYCSPVFTDFNHMQDSLRSAYEEVSDLIGAKVAPVGMAWKRSLSEDSTVVLHASDNSHPALTGSYLASCIFYSAIWQTSPVGINYLAGLPAAQVLRFQEIADSVYFHDSSDWNRNIEWPVANFNYTLVNDTFCFTNTSTGPDGTTYHWSFGDGSTATSLQPCHSYSLNGTFPVSLIATHCSYSDTFSISVPWYSTNVQSDLISTGIKVYPNPVSDFLVIETDAADKGAELILSDPLGQLVRREKLNDFRQNLDVRQLPSGMYVIRIKNQSWYFIKD